MKKDRIKEMILIFVPVLTITIIVSLVDISKAMFCLIISYIVFFNITKYKVYGSDKKLRFKYNVISLVFVISIILENVIFIISIKSTANDHYKRLLLSGNTLSNLVLFTIFTIISYEYIAKLESSNSKGI